MTVNIALLSRDALIFGCDSVASTTALVVQPWDHLEKDAQGNPKTDAEGRMVARFTWANTEQIVTDVWAGVNKMFELHRNGAKVAATTSGIAVLNDRSIENLATEFFKRNAGLARSTVEAVAHEFLEFMFTQYEKHFPEGMPKEWKTDVEFLIGGYGTADNAPCLYRVHVRDKQCKCEATPGNYGLIWAGQSDAVARLIFGYDQSLPFRMRHKLASALEDAHKEYAVAVTRILGDVLAKLGTELPADVDTALPARKEVDVDLSELRLDIECANLPLQDAVDLVSFLVNLQSGRSKFVRGVATVGGRTRIGVITKLANLRMINEPEILHRNVGFGFDL